MLPYLWVDYQETVVFLCFDLPVETLLIGICTVPGIENNVLYTFTERLEVKDGRCTTG